MQFLLIAYDGKDDKALERRMAVREAHMALADINKATGHALYGGAILDDNGKMIGSMMVVDYPDQAAVDAWLKEEPYVTGKVWTHIEVKPFRLGPTFCAAKSAA